jgi:hypothetical protein
VGGLLVTDELVEIEKKSVEVQDCKKITDHFRGIYRNMPQFDKGKLKDINPSSVVLQPPPSAKDSKVHHMFSNQGLKQIT